MEDEECVSQNGEEGGEDQAGPGQARAKFLETSLINLR